MTYLAGDVLPAEDLNVPLFHAVQTVSQSVAHATVSPVTFTSEVVDTHNGHSTSSQTSRYTATVAGWYLCTGVISWDGDSAADSRRSYWRVNGSTLVAGSRTLYEPEAAIPISIPAVTTLVHLNISDYVELCAFQDSGGAVDTWVDGANPHDYSSITIVCVRRD